MLREHTVPVVMLFHVMHLATHEGMGAALLATCGVPTYPRPEFPERDEKSLKKLYRLSNSWRNSIQTLQGRQPLSTLTDMIPAYHP